MISRESICLGLLLLAAPLCAAVIHVPGDQPTIQAGIAAAATADTVLVAPGRYAESIALADGVAVIGAGAGTTMIDGADSEVVVEGADGARLAGFWITGGATGVRCLDTSPIVEDDVIDCGVGVDCHVSYQQGPITPIIRRNVILSAEKGIHLFEQAFADGGADAVIENNTIHGAGVAIQYRSHMALPSVRRNIVAGCEVGIYLTYCNLFEERLSRISCNDVWANQQDYAVDDPGCGPFDMTGYRGNVRVDPRFCSGHLGDFTLCGDSPCAEANNPECGHLGALPIACDPCGPVPTATATWGSIKESFRR
ncbi:MAG: hypothetical protein R3D98_07065 [Candidatus Krumholzibacteriia bacterium]